MTTPNPGSPLWPVNFQGCRIQAQYLTLDGLPITVGTVTFTASPTALLDAPSDLVIVPKVFTATLNSSGVIDIVLPATDDPDINPINWTYAVSENFTGGRKYNIHAPQGTTINLVDVSPVPNSQGQPIYRGPQGPAGGVQYVNGHTGDVVVLDYTDVGADPAGAAASVLSTSLQKAANLSDITSASAARASLGLTPIAIAVFGTATGQVMQGNQSAGGDLAGSLPNPTLKDSGWINGTGGWGSYNGSTILNAGYRVVGNKIVQFYVSFTNGITLTPGNNSGNLGNVGVIQVPSAITPTTMTGNAISFMGSSNGPAYVKYYLDYTGEIFIEALGNGFSLSGTTITMLPVTIGHNMNISGTYLI